MSFLIRPATGADSPHAAEVVKAVFQEYDFTWDADDYCADLYDLEAHYLSLGSHFWVAEVDGWLCGTTALELHDLLPGTVGESIISKDKVRAAGSDCSLERLYVHPGARSLGIGRALLETSIGKARGLGRKSMEIWSDKKLENAHRLYGHYAAIAIGDRICDDPDESPEWGFVIRL
jgi:putative acetyltransferase